MVPSALKGPEAACSDWEQTALSRETMLFAPLREAGAQLSFYAHSFLPEEYGMDMDDADPIFVADESGENCPALTRMVAGMSRHVRTARLQSDALSSQHNIAMQRRHVISPARRPSRGGTTTGRRRAMRRRTRACSRWCSWTRRASTPCC